MILTRTSIEDLNLGHDNVTVAFISAGLMQRNVFPESLSILSLTGLDLYLGS